MPGTQEEFLAPVDGLVTERISPHVLDDLCWGDGTVPTAAEMRQSLNMYTFVMRVRCKPPGQRLAMKLLRSLLSPRQRRMLRTHGHFYASTKSGATFRFLPWQGFTERVKRHGSRYFRVSHFCLHDENNLTPLPPADVVTAHLLLLVADEAKFLELANEHASSSDLWNGEYLRRMRRRHIA